jgi:hypothetical protein
LFCSSSFPVFLIFFLGSFFLLLFALSEVLFSFRGACARVGHNSTIPALDRALEQHIARDAVDERGEYAAEASVLAGGLGLKEFLQASESAGAGVETSPFQ